MLIASAPLPSIRNNALTLRRPPTAYRPNPLPLILAYDPGFTVLSLVVSVACMTAAFFVMGLDLGSDGSQTRSRHFKRPRKSSTGRGGPRIPVQNSEKGVDKPGVFIINQSRQERVKSSNVWSALQGALAWTMVDMGDEARDVSKLQDQVKLAKLKAFELEELHRAAPDHATALEKVISEPTSALGLSSFGRSQPAPFDGRSSLFSPDYQLQPTADSPLSPNFSQDEIAPDEDTIVPMGEANSTARLVPPPLLTSRSATHLSISCTAPSRSTSPIAPLSFNFIPPSTAPVYSTPSAYSFGLQIPPAALSPSPRRASLPAIFGKLPPRKQPIVAPVVGDLMTWEEFEKTDIGGSGMTWLDEAPTMSAATSSSTQGCKGDRSSREDLEEDIERGRPPSRTSNPPKSSSRTSSSPPRLTLSTSLEDRRMEAYLPPKDLDAANQQSKVAFGQANTPPLAGGVSRLSSYLGYHDATRQEILKVVVAGTICGWGVAGMRTSFSPHYESASYHLLIRNLLQTTSVSVQLCPSHTSATTPVSSSSRSSSRAVPSSSDSGSCSSSSVPSSSIACRSVFSWPVSSVRRRVRCISRPWPVSPIPSFLPLFRVLSWLTLPTRALLWAQLHRMPSLKAWTCRPRPRTSRSGPSWSPRSPLWPSSRV